MAKEELQVLNEVGYGAILSEDLGNELSKKKTGKFVETEDEEENE